MSTGATRSPTLRARRRRELWRNVAFLSPWLLGTGLFFIYPLVTTAWLSFTHYDGFTSPVWTGWANWHYVLHDYPFFWPALRNTMWFVVVLVSLRVMTGMALGMTVIAVKRGSSVLRTAFYAPYLAPPVAATLAFVFLLNPGTGPVNSILGKLGLPSARLVQRPDLVEARADPARDLGRRRPDGDLHGRAARRTARALRGGRAGRRRERSGGSGT